MLSKLLDFFYEEKTFDSEEDFVNFINKRRDLNSRQKKEIIKHEKAHYDKAIELGYLPKYGFRKIREAILISHKNPFVVARATDFQDYSTIALAPKDPSFSDLCNSKGIKYAMKYKIKSSFSHIRGQ